MRKPQDIRKTTGKKCPSFGGGGGGLGLSSYRYHALRWRTSPVSATVNGLGERAGNAFLEEIATALKISAGIDCGIHLRWTN